MKKSLFLITRQEDELFVKILEDKKKEIQKLNEIIEKKDKIIQDLLDEIECVNNDLDELEEYFNIDLDKDNCDDYSEKADKVKTEEDIETKKFVLKRNSQPVMCIDSFGNIYIESDMDYNDLEREINQIIKRTRFF